MATALRRPSPITVVALATALSLMGDSMLYIALPIYWREAGLDSLWQVGALLSVNRLIRLPFNPLVGWCYRRISLRAGLILAVLLGVVTSCGYALASSFVVWLVLRGMWGIAWSFFRIGGLTTVIQCAAADGRGRAMGRYNGLYRLGSLAGMLLGGLLVPFYGLPALACSFGLLSLAGVALLLFAFDPPGVVEQAPDSVSASVPGFGLALQRRWLVLGSGFCIAMLVQGVLAATLSALIEHLYGERFELFGLLLGATALGGLLQAARWSWETWLGSRIGAWSDGPRGRVPLQIGVLLLAALTFAPLAYAAPLPVWLGVSLLVMLLSTALTTLNDALAGDVARQTHVLRFTTRYSIVQDLGAAVGPVLAFLLLTLADGFAWLYGGGALVYAVLALFWWRAWRQSRWLNAGT